MDEVINSLNRIWYDKSKLKFLEAEIFKLRKGNTSLKDDSKSTLKIVELLITCEGSCTNARNAKLHVQLHSYQQKKSNEKRLEPIKAKLTFSTS